MTTAIKIENLSKKYVIGHQRQQQFDTLRDVLIHKFRGLSQRIRHPLSPNPEKIHQEDLWALRDINLEIHQGERIGIIGRNGAGKSTLLKVLSRITEPTEGRFTMNGRVASLLEVGTGFHPELSGCENIFLNGAILGMSKAEIKRKFDEIVEFADVKKFLDTPVKRYSSGMYVRLAFSVAAHLDSEILIVDEVLAVGDAEFQKKCLGKMKDVTNSGRTVLFVSHNMGMITSLCESVIVLDRGEIINQGAAPDMVNFYFGHGNVVSYITDYDKPGHRVGDELAALLDAHIENSKGAPTPEIDIREPITVKMRYRLHQRVSKAPYANFHFFDTKGECAFISSGEEYLDCNGMEPGIYVAECVVPPNLLNNGTYFVGLALTFTHQSIHVSFFEKDALCITVIDPLEETTDTLRCGYSGPIPGVVRPKLEWRIRKEA